MHLDLLPNTSQITRCHLELAYQFILPDDPSAPFTLYCQPDHHPCDSYTLSKCSAIYTACLCVCLLLVDKCLYKDKISHLLYFELFLCKYREPWAVVKKSFMLVWCYHQLHLPQLSCQSRLLTNDTGDNEMILGAMHRTSGIYLKVEENPRNRSKENVWWRLCNQSWGPLPTNDINMIAQHIREGEGRKAEKDGKHMFWTVVNGVVVCSQKKL